ncbi:MAG: RNA-directed DNA polymerase [Pedobacter sp.]|nr:MAG: RNA-directed DNA polymerase [Pedobacter sp.]
MPIKTENLVSKGYFPEELVPAFTTEDLAKITSIVITNLNTFDPLGRKKTSIPLLFSIPKVKGYRRNLTIPNPLHYFRLCDTIVSNWPAILAHTQLSNISMTKLDLGGNRSILKLNFDEFISQRILRSAGYRYLLKIDISRFYNSIYTHSIPWALHTKAVSKVNRRRASHFGNALDEDSRKIQDGQTIGIPIGPDTSRIISEIILASIDKELSNHLPNFKGVRIIDDYYLYFKNIAHIEIARSVVHKALKDYELELNQGKETIAELPEIIESPWYTALKNVRFTNDVRTQKKELIEFFDKAFRFAKEHEEEAVMSYAIAKIRPTIFKVENLPMLQALLLNSLVLEPKTISLLSEILIGYSASKRRLNLELLRTALNEFVIFHSELNNEYEISWALWTLKALKIKVSAPAAKLLSKSNNSLIMLMVLDLKRSKLIPKGLNISHWRIYLKGDSLFNEHWLFAYEVKVRGWMRTTDNYIDTEPFFNLLKAKKVRFYKGDKKLDVSKVRVTISAGSTTSFESVIAFENLFDGLDSATKVTSDVPF